MIAAIQAPVIMMSPNRLSVKDSLDAAHDYEVKLKAKMEIAKPHRKLDGVCEKPWAELIEMQQKQFRLMTKLLEEKNKQIITAMGASKPHCNSRLAVFQDKSDSAISFAGKIIREINDGFSII
jgi:uncharacterized membrane protein